MDCIRSTPVYPTGQLSKLQELREWGSAQRWRYEKPAGGRLDGEDRRPPFVRIRDAEQYNVQADNDCCRQGIVAELLEQDIRRHREHRAFFLSGRCYVVDFSM